MIERPINLQRNDPSTAPYSMVPRGAARHLGPATMPTSHEDPNPRAHLAAALALSDPLTRPTLTLSGLHTDAIARRAYALGTAPAVVSNLIDIGAGHTLSEYDHSLYPVTLARNLIALSLADEAAALIEAQGIRCAPMKGYGMLLDLYTDIGRRRMFDVDMIIDCPTFERAIPPLRSLGWQRQTQPPVTSRLNIEAVFTREVGGFKITLELHRRLCFPWRFSIDTASLWDRATQSATKAPTWRLDPTHMLLYLACHKAQHGYLNDSRDLIDAANLARSMPIDWPRLALTAARWSCRGAAWLFLKRCQRARGLDLPADLLGSLAPTSGRAAALDALMPDATLDPAFMQVRNNRRPLGKKTLTGLIATDAPAREAAALGLIGARSLSDQLAIALDLSPERLDWLNTIPFNAAS